MPPVAIASDFFLVRAPDTVGSATAEGSRLSCPEPLGYDLMGAYLIDGSCN